MALYGLKYQNDNILLLHMAKTQKIAQNELSHLNLSFFFDIADVHFILSTFLTILGLTLKVKRQTKIAADGTLFFYFYLSKEIRLAVSCESSA